MGSGEREWQIRNGLFSSGANSLEVGKGLGIAALFKAAPKEQDKAELEGQGFLVWKVSWVLSVQGSVFCPFSHSTLCFNISPTRQVP